MTPDRSQFFQKNELLEKEISKLAEVLSNAESLLSSGDSTPNKPVLFIVGSPRSGTTLLYQTLAHSGAFAYPTNFLSRFYASLGIGCKIQKLLFDQRFQYRDELALYHSEEEVSLSSELGKTKGALAPNVFWYFWYHHFSFGDTHYLSPDEWRNSNVKRFLSELALMQAEMEKPLVMKAMVLNWNLEQLACLSNQFLFLNIERELCENAESIYKARKRYSGSYEKWWSFKPPEYNEICHLSPHQQVAAFCLSIKNSIQKSWLQIPEEQKLELSYEEFCSTPKVVFDKICNRAQVEYDERSLDSLSRQVNKGKKLDDGKRKLWEKAFAEVEQEFDFL